MKRMKLIHYIYCVPLAFLAACSSEEMSTAEELHPNGAIELSADIVEGGSKLMTRAGTEDNHARHLNLTSGTALALQVRGKWTGHAPNPVVKTTKGTIGSTTGADSKHNVVTCDPVLYWDDYGTADPANAETGRAEGLTIYGAAINGQTTAPTVSDYTALSWTLYADQTQNNQKPEDTDLLISNNVKAGTGDGTYKFDERASGKLLEFRHALSKITVNLKAGAGFSGNVFAATPAVTLVNKEGTTTSSDSWAYTRGNINITTGVVSSLANSAVITMNAGTTDATLTAAGYTVTKEALVIPGSLFEGDAAIIARINADGNIYYVTAEKIRTAINSSTHGTDGAYATEAGKNYIINVIVNKTDIVVTATVTNWTDVTAEEVSPVINVSAAWGSSGSAMGDGSFSFYRSTSLNTGYGSVTGSYYGKDSEVTKSGDDWTMSPQLYWPNHNTHYQFRGVMPQTGTETGTVSYPRVETATHSSVEYQVIKVQNVAYTSGTFPSDLQIARPEIDANEQCTNTETGHTKTYLYDGGICATEGTINLNFKYMMSQVEVNLSTTDGSDKVDLEGAIVDIINVYNNGDVKLGDRGVIPTGDKGSYTLNPVAGSGNANKRWSAIVPQELAYDMTNFQNNAKFRIKIINTNGTPDDDTDDTVDTYYADIAPIKKKGSTTDYVATHQTSPEKWLWESGVHYVYNLKLSKTEIKISATLANWTTVTADENVWF